MPKLYIHYLNFKSLFIQESDNNNEGDYVFSLESRDDRLAFAIKPIDMIHFYNISPNRAIPYLFSSSLSSDCPTSKPDIQAKILQSRHRGHCE